jgi:hypothetical protein
MGKGLGSTSCRTVAPIVAQRASATRRSFSRKAISKGLRNQNTAKELFCGNIIWTYKACITYEVVLIVQQSLLGTANSSTIHKREHQVLNIIHSVHFLFYVYCPTIVHIYSPLICETHFYMFRTLSRFIFRDFSILNYTYFLINGTILHWLK